MRSCLDAGTGPGPSAKMIEEHHRRRYDSCRLSHLARVSALRHVKREVSSRMRCFTRDRSEAQGEQPLTPLVCLSLTSWRHTPANAVTGPTNRDARQGAHENLPEGSSKMSSARDTNTSHYNTLIQQCMSKAQTNKPIIA